MAKDQNSGGSILVAHIADTHLRDTQYVSARRGLDFYKAAVQAVSKASAAADILVLAGDIFDRSRPSPAVIGQLMFLDALLQKQKKVLLAVTGNHDWSDPTWLSVLFPDRTSADGDTALGSDSCGIIPIDGKSVTFRGFRFSGVKPLSTPAFRSKLSEVSADTKDADVVLYHNLITGIVPMYAGKGDPLRADELPVSKSNKAWLLGDIHVQGYIERDRPGGGKTLIGYPGSSEMCSASEPIDKSVPLIRLTSDSAAVEDRVPLEIRPFISGEIRSDEDLDKIVADISKVADADPVVVVQFDRELTQTISRIHSLLDAQKSVIRCHALPVSHTVTARPDDTPGDEFDVMHFLLAKFEGDPELGDIAAALLTQGEQATGDIIGQFIEKRLASVAVREEE